MHDLYPTDLATLDRATLEETVRRRTQTTYLGDGIVMARALTRYKMFLHSDDHGFACHLMMDGYWEIWVTQFFARNIEPGMHVVDVGANYGYYTMLFADIVGQSGKVLAVEPNPAAAKLLQQSLQLNGFAGHVQVVEAGLGANIDATSEFFVPAHEPKNAHFSCNPSEHGTVHVVPLTTLDALTPHLDRVDLIKIDAEGSEEAIIAGMTDLLHRDRPSMVLEFNSRRCVNPGALLDKLLRMYGSISVIGYDGNAAPVDPAVLLTKDVGQDWMLYCCGKGPTQR